jgi:hypothetical protein
MIFALMAQEVVPTVKPLDTTGPVARERRHSRLGMLELMSQQVLWITTAGEAAAFLLALVAVGFFGVCFLMVPIRCQQPILQ